MRQLRTDFAAGRFGLHCSESCPVLRRRNDLDTCRGQFSREAPGLTPAQAENRRRAMEHYERRDLRVESDPLYVRVFPTNRCGVACIMCGTWREEPKRERDFLREFGKELPNAMVLEAAGGEPLLSRTWLEFLGTSGERYPGLRVKMITNGKFLSESVIRDYFPPPRTWEWVGVSMDANEPETLGRIRKGLRLDELRAGLARLVSYARGEFPVSVMVTVMRENVHELQALAQWFLDTYGRQRAVFMNFSRVLGGWHGQGRFTPQEIEIILRFCAEHAGTPRIEGLDVLPALAAGLAPGGRVDSRR